MSESSFHKGAINEVIVTDDVMSDIEKNYIGQYLSDKWKNPLRPPVVYVVPQMLTTNLSGSLSSTTGSWYNGPLTNYFYTWEISTDGQTQWQTKSASSKLTLLPSDYETCYGKYIRVGVKAKNVAGTSKRYAYSTVELISTYPISSLQITRTDTSVFGVSVLNSSVWSSLPEITSVSFNWQVSSLTSVDWETIPGVSSSYFYLSSQHKALTAFNVRGIEWAHTTMGKVASAVSLSSLYYKFETPADLPKLSLWLDASDSSTVITKPLFGDSSWAFDGTNYVGGTTGYTFPSNNFTIEMWIRFTSVSGFQRIIGTYSDRYENNESRGWSIWLDSSKIRVGFAGAPTHITSDTSVVADVWYHIAVTGSSGTPNQYKLYINGTQEGLTYTGSRSYSGRALRISSFDTYNYYMFGSRIQYLRALVSNVRIVDGTTVYTGPFDPTVSSAVPLSLIGSNTSLLAFQNQSLTNLGNGGNIGAGGLFNIKPGSTVESWLDKSPNSLTAAQPQQMNGPDYKLAEINGLNVVDFGTTINKNFFTLTSSISTDSDWTHFAVYRRPNDGIISTTLGTTGRVESVFVQWQADNKIYSGSKTTNTGVLSTGVNVISIRKNNQLKLNKILQPTFTQAWASQQSTQTDLVGRYYNNSPTYNMYSHHSDALGEIIQTSNLLPEYEVNLVDDYLFTKWKTLTNKPYCILKPTFITSNSAALSVNAGMWAPMPFKYYYDWFTSDFATGPWTSISLDLSTTNFSVTPAHSGLYFYVSVSAENVLGISPSPSATDVLQLTSIVLNNPIATKTSLVGVSGTVGLLSSTLPLSTTSVWQICSDFAPTWTALDGPSASSSFYFLSSEYNNIIGLGLSGFNVRYSTIGVNGFSTLTAFSSPVFIKKYETPKDFSNLALWLDASDHSSVKTSGKPNFGPKSTYAANFTNNSSKYITASKTSGGTFMPSNQSWKLECFINIQSQTGAAQCIAGNVSSSTNGWEFIIAQDLNSISLSLKSGGAGISASYKFLTGIWYHICLSFNVAGRSAKLFINGNLVSASTLGTFTDNTWINIGKLGYLTYQYPFNGYISNFRIGIGASEPVTSEPNIQIPVPTTGTLCCLTLSPVLQDFTSNSNVVSYGGLTLDSVSVLINFETKVNAWLDKSAKQLSAIQPIFNNKPSYGPTYTINDLSAVWFDGANGFLGLNVPLTAVNSTPHSHFFVYNRRVPSNIYSVSLGLSSGSSTSTEILYIHWGVDNKIYFGSGKGVTTTPIVSAGTFLGSTTTTPRLYLNRGQQAVGGNWGTPTANIVDSVGRARSITNGYHDGLMGEIIHITEVLPEFERKIIEDQLHDKWFVIKNIPVVKTPPVVFENSFTSTLSTTVGTWTASPTSYDIQWQYSNDGLNWSDVPLATGTSLPPLFNSYVESYRTKVIAKNVVGSSESSYSNIITFASTNAEDLLGTTFTVSALSVPEADLNSTNLNYYNLTAEDFASSQYLLTSFAVPDTDINTIGANYYSLSTEDSTSVTFGLSSFAIPEVNINVSNTNYYSLSFDDSTANTYQLTSFEVPVSSIKSVYKTDPLQFNLVRTSIYGVSSTASQALGEVPTKPITTWIWELSNTNTNGFSSVYTKTGNLYLSGANSPLDASVNPVNVKLSVLYNGSVYESTEVSRIEPYSGLHSIPNIEFRLDASDSSTVKTSAWPFFDESCNFNGSSYVTAPSSSAFVFGTADFTVECWVNFNVLGTTSQVIVGNWSSLAAGNMGWQLYYQGSTKRIAFWLNNKTVILAPTTLLPNKWNHVAVTRQGNSLKLYLNGFLEASVVDSTNISNGSLLEIGYQSTGSARAYFAGYISNLRIVSGYAVYTSTSPFSPPSNSLVAIGGPGIQTPVVAFQTPSITNNGGNVSGITLTAYSGAKARTLDPIVTQWLDKSVNSLSANQFSILNAPSFSAIGIRNLSAVVFDGQYNHLNISSPLRVDRPYTAFFVYDRLSHVNTISLGCSAASSSTSPYLHWNTDVIYGGSSMYTSSNVLGKLIGSVRKDQRAFLGDTVQFYTGPWGGTKLSAVDSVGRYSKDYYHGGAIFEYIQTSCLLPDNEMQLITKTLSSKWF